jgi:hypothetical protein
MRNLSISGFCHCPNRAPCCVLNSEAWYGFGEKLKTVEATLYPEMIAVQTQDPDRSLRISYSWHDTLHASIAPSRAGAIDLNRQGFKPRVFGTNGMLFLNLGEGYMVCHRNGGCDNNPPRRDTAIYPHEAPAKNLIHSTIDPARNKSAARLRVAAMEETEAALISAPRGANIFVHDRVR